MRLDGKGILMRDLHIKRTNRQTDKLLYIDLLTRAVKILENVTLILTLEKWEFLWITLKIFSKRISPHSHSQILRIFKDSQEFLEKPSNKGPSINKIIIEEGEWSTKNSNFGWTFMNHLAKEKENKKYWSLKFHHLWMALFGQ